MFCVSMLQSRRRTPGRSSTPPTPVIQIPARTWEEARSRLSGARVASWTAGPPGTRLPPCRSASAIFHTPPSHLGTRRSQITFITHCLHIFICFFSLIFIKEILFISPQEISHLTFSRFASKCGSAFTWGGLDMLMLAAWRY